MTEGVNVLPSVGDACEDGSQKACSVHLPSEVARGNVSGGDPGPETSGPKRELGGAGMTREKTTGLVIVHVASRYTRRLLARGGRHGDRRGRYRTCRRRRRDRSVWRRDGVVETRETGVPPRMSPCLLRRRGKRRTVVYMALSGIACGLAVVVGFR